MSRWSLKDWSDIVRGRRAVFSILGGLVLALSGMSYEAAACQGDLAGGPIDCINYANYLHIVGEVDLTEAFDVAVSGSHAYVADGHSDLRIVDISDPATPTIVARVVHFDKASSVEVSGDYAYVANQSALVIVDISTPVSPSIIGEIETPGRVYGVAVVAGAVIEAFCGAACRLDQSQGGDEGD